MGYRDLPLGGIGERWREFYRARPWLRGYNASFFPGLRYRLQRWTGLLFFQRGTGPDGPASHFLIAAYHPRTSITWLWQINWWPPRSWRRPWGSFICSTQDRMTWRKGSFAKQDEQTLH